MSEDKYAALYEKAKTIGFRPDQTSTEAFLVCYETPRSTLLVGIEEHNDGKDTDGLELSITGNSPDGAFSCCFLSQYIKDLDVAFEFMKHYLSILNDIENVYFPESKSIRFYFYIDEIFGATAKKLAKENDFENAELVYRVSEKPTVHQDLESAFVEFAKDQGLDLNKLRVAAWKAQMIQSNDKTPPMPSE
jgi:hypothetical protein